MAEFTAEQIAIMVRAAELTVKNNDMFMRADETVNLAAGDGSNDLAFPRVRPGRVLVLDYLSGFNNTSASTRIRVGYWNGHGYNWLKTVLAPIASETVELNGRILLRQGMFPVVRFEGCTNLDDIYATLNGYSISA